MGLKFDLHSFSFLTSHLKLQKFYQVTLKMLFFFFTSVFLLLFAKRLTSCESQDEEWYCKYQVIKIVWPF